MKYFHIMHGLRGCYMPDSAHCIAVKTRRELKEHIESEAESYRSDGYVGASNAAIATLAADAWHNANRVRPAVYPHVLGLAAPHARTDYIYGIHVSTVTRAEFEAAQEESI